MIILKDYKININTDGYLNNFQEWSEFIANLLAKQENIFLTEKHWEIIYFIREFYISFNTSPSMRMLVKAITKKYNKDISNTQYLYHLFPKGPAIQATKIAGLPKQVKCI